MNKSKELAKLLGIEDKDIYIGKKKENLCNHCQDNCYYCENKLYKKEYPDFTKPSNFVKLLQIISSLANKPIVLNFDYHEDITEGFIWQLISLFEGRASGLTLLNTPSKKFTKQNIQHQAQQTEWEY